MTSDNKQEIKIIKQEQFIREICSDHIPKGYTIRLVKRNSKRSEDNKITFETTIIGYKSEKELEKLKKHHALELYEEFFLGKIKKPNCRRGKRGVNHGLGSSGKKKPTSKGL